MRNREEIISRIEYAWVLSELLYEMKAFDDDELLDKTVDVVRAFADIIYELVGIDEEEQDIIQSNAYDKYKKIMSIINKPE